VSNIIANSDKYILEKKKFIVFGKKVFSDY